MRQARFRSEISVGVVAALVTLSGAARADMPDKAFWMDLRVGGGVSLNGQFFPTPAIVLGARFASRVQLGGALSYWRFAGRGQSTVGTVLAAPDLEVDLFKSADDRMALFLGLGMPLGGTTGANKAFAVGYRVALGIRYAPHPNFAMGVEAGGQGLFFDEGGDSWSNIQSVYGALFGTFYSGHRATPKPVEHRAAENRAAAAPPTRATPQPASAQPASGPEEVRPPPAAQ